jgi:hypothetical protein
MTVQSRAMPACTICDDCGWVCETLQTGHGRDRELAHAVAPVLRVPAAIQATGLSPPRLPAGFKADIESDG